MKTVVKLNEKQRKAFSEIVNAVNTADVNLKNQQDKMGAFLTGLGTDIPNQAKINITEEGLEIENQEESEVKPS